MITESQISDEIRKFIQGKAQIICDSFANALRQCKEMRVHVLTIDEANKSASTRIQSIQPDDLKKYLEGLANIPQEYRSKAVRHLLDDLNPRSIGLQIATAIDAAINASISRYEELVREISNANPANDLKMYELPEARAIAFATTTKAQALEPFQEANRLGIYISTIHETLNANYAHYTGDAAKQALQEKRDASVLRKLRPFLRAVSPHPLISAAIQTGSDLFVDHKIDRSIAKYRVIYTETLAQYLVGYIAFIERLEQAIPASIEIVTKKIQSVCVNAPLDMIVSTVESGGVNPYAPRLGNDPITSKDEHERPKEKSSRTALFIIPGLFILFAIILAVYIYLQKAHLP